MPLVRIDLLTGTDAGRVRRIADGVQDALVRTYGIPERDRFQIITEHAASQIIALDAGLGFERSAGVVMIQIFTQQGRTAEAKQQLYAAVCTELQAAGVEPEDVFISYIESGPEDWSFGFGRAQYATGELAVPKAD
ncbi:tautomerase family protein [Amnibacterium kyonggiense]|uniref:Tautomerase-like protein n=1 Tax=Amnibacterium kyonggiense TaxID=595671 RepID=A0A4R7FIM3_9MICO|nr:tautomerase family protein [Amnibacterium kyonggiense]TDS76091.1 tautomerase-like protein [Amnibacterium kyonggiense]